jgi:hypothetical protein
MRPSNRVVILTLKWRYHMGLSNRVVILTLKWRYHMCLSNGGIICVPQMEVSYASLK